MGRWLVVCLVVVCLAGRGWAESVWPQFRGPNGQGHSTATGLPLTWNESENVAWKTPIPGRGWSSPVLADGRVWLTTATVTSANEADRAAAVAGNPLADQMELAKEVSLWAVEVDLASGMVLRTIHLFDVSNPPAIHSLNSFASPTPVLADDRLYCHFGTFGTLCLDTASGDVVWQRQFQHEHYVGPGSSPYLYDGVLIIPCDGADKQFIEAVDAATGDTVWHADRPPIRNPDPDWQKAFCTPLVFTHQGVEQVVIPGAQWFIAYDPHTGKEIWRIDHGSGFSNVPAPVYDGQMVYLCTGFATSSLWAIRPDGQGDLNETHVAWKFKKQIPNMSSPVLEGKNIYTVSDSGVATCLDAATGERHWQQRLGGNFSASPLAAEGRIYFCNRDGETTVIAAGDEYEELAKNQLDGQLMASPTVAESDLLLRTGTHLYRVGR